MGLLETLFQGEHANILSHLQNETSLSSEQLEGITGHLLPKVTQAIQGSMTDGNLMEKLVGLMSQVDFSQISANPSQLMGAHSQEMGSHLLNGLFGSEESVSKVMASLSQNFSVDSGTISKLLPALSTAVVGAVMKQGGGLSSLVTSMFNKTGSATTGAENGLMGMAKGLLDSDHDGSIADDLLSGFAKKLM